MDRHLRNASIMANLLDARFSFFGRKFGINAILDLIPGFGDGLALFFSFYLIWIAMQLNVPTAKIVEMILNILISFFIGLIPVVGDVGYLFMKPNLKNLAIIKQYAKEHPIEGEIIDKNRLAF